MKNLQRGIQALALTMAAICVNTTFASEGEWVDIFNGKNLDGWTPKISGAELGENYKDTFRVEDGVLKISYDNYEVFDNNYGHLFYKTPYSNYRLKVDYRFTGEQAKNAPAWAYRNAGIMFHTPHPKTMRKDQWFPVCVELQMLGGNGTDERSTGNICSPSSHVVIDGELVKDHCINSSSKTFHGDQWVTLELEVNGNGQIRHIVNGEVVFDYEKPELDLDDKDGLAAHESGLPVQMSEGYFALQAEGHPVEYKNVQLLVLDN